MEYLDSRKFLSLLYHDLFEYPLTWEELKRWEVKNSLEGDFPVEKTGKFYHLPGRAELVTKRLARQKASRNKKQLAQRAVERILKIPTVLLVGITGALAMENAREEDDIDLLVVTQKGTLWTTRFAVIQAIELFGPARRKPNDSKVEDKLCLNLWLDEDNLAIPAEKRNIYTGHEVLQVVPLASKKGTYSRFIQANNWAREFWPRAVSKKLKTSLPSQSPNSLFGVFEPLARNFQLWYMRKRRTREMVEPGRAFFHPVDWQKPVLEAFELRLARYMPQVSKTPQTIETT